MNNTMTRRKFIKTTTTAGLASSTVSGCVFNILKKTKPNFLFIITDQQYLQTISALGNEDVNTPAQDTLMKNGLSFTNSYSTNPVCSPARSSMFTGRMPSETSVWKNGSKIRKDIPMMGDWFRDQSDYETVYAGKWHLPEYYIAKIPGFDCIMSGWGGQGIVSDSAKTLACEAYLRQYNSKNPFLMVTSYMQPHDVCEWLRLNTNNQAELRYPELVDKLPELPPNFDTNFKEPAYFKTLKNGQEPFKGKWEEQHWRYYLWAYYRQVEMVDAEIARLLQTLEETGLNKNTVVIFTSDHGEGLGHHKTVRKLFFYESSAAVPFIISAPGLFPENEINRTDLVSGLDIMPTMCDLSGIPIPAGTKGISLNKLLVKKVERQFVVTETFGDRGQMVRSENYKYIIFKNDPNDLLFDMKNDPHETINLAPDAKYASIVQEHRNYLKNWRGRLDIDPNMPDEVRFDDKRVMG